jgi:NarL family two-component system response regulator LiaR
MGKIRVLIADNHPVFREGLSRLFQEEEDLECVATAQDGKEAVMLAQKLQPDVAIIDVNMPETSGIEAVKQIKKACPNTGILMLSAYKYSHYVISSIQAGADGYLVKNIPRQKLVEAIRLIHTGQGVFNLEASSGVLRRLVTRANGISTSHTILHDRELEVLKLVARGMTNKQIANELNISENTVGTHLVKIFRKLGVQSRTEAILYALREGLIATDEIAGVQET